MQQDRNLLRKQMELLAEQSKSATDSELARLSTAMCDVYDRLNRNCPAIVLFPAVGLYLLICILVHI